MYGLGDTKMQGLELAPNGIVYSSEHGPQSDDELNIINSEELWLNVMGFVTVFRTIFCEKINWNIN